MKTSILRTMVLTLFVAVTSHISAQFKVTMESCNDPNLQFVYAANTEESTFIYVTKTSKEENENFTCAPLTANAGYKKYKMKNCYNVPKYNEAEPACVVLDKSGQSHNFILEFEKLPMNTTFDIIEDANEALAEPWTFSGVMIDTLSRTEAIDPYDFVNATPSKLFGKYATKGTVYNYYMNNGIVLTAHFAKGRNYGKYYQVYLDIINNTDHSIAFTTDNVETEGYVVKKGKTTSFALETLSASDYDKKVRKSQAWSRFFNALGESLAAEEAGKTTVNTTSRTTTTGDSYTSGEYSGGSVSAGAAVGSRSAAVGVGASAYAGRSYSDTHSSKTSTTHSSTVIRDGAIQYMARQQAAQNIAAYDNALANDRANLWEHYLKVNTIKSGESYGGFFNIKYKKANGLIIKIKIDGVVYAFPVIV